jgi:hypothetical protein
MPATESGAGGGRLPPPAVPQGMTLHAFGHIVMRWGAGSEAARARTTTLTQEELVRAGVTREMAEAWRDFYLHELRRNPQNPSAAGRAELMQRAIELLRGG